MFIVFIKGMDGGLFDSDKLISAIIGLLAGALGTFLAPWVHWGIEKRKIRMRNRKELIERCKKEINSTEFDYVDFREKSDYANLRPFLSDRIKQDVERNELLTCINVVGRGRGINNVVPGLLDDIHKLEKKWGLI